MTRRFTLLLSFTLALFAIVSLMANADEAKDNIQLVKDAYPDLTSGALTLAKVVDLPSDILLRSGKIEISQKDIDAEIASAPEELRTQLAQYQFLVLENKATQALLEDEAGNWAKENKRPTDEAKDQLMQAYILSLTSNVSVSDDEAKSFFDQNKDMMGDATFEQVKDQLKEYMLGQKRQEAVGAHVATIGARHEIEINKTWAAKQYTAAMDNPLDKARKSGKPTMVDLGADGCKPCEMMTPVLEELKKEYEGKVNVLFVHVRKEQVLAARYGVQAIPVQIFFDKDGKEVFRHVGFFAKDQIITKLTEMGVK